MMQFDEECANIADYFVVAGLTEDSKPLDDELFFPDVNHKRKAEPKDPITDVCIIDRTLEERCPQGYTCIEQTPLGFQANLNHGSITAHDLMLCYKRGRDRPPLVEIGVYYEGMEKIKTGIGVAKVTPTGKSANINNKTGIGSHPIYLTYQRAKESDPQSTLVVTDICVILSNKGEQPPHAFCKIDKNINKGMIGSSVYICYKKSMRQVNSIAFRAGILSRYPMDNNQASFPLPASVGLFCLPMGATIECWTDKTRHPLPSFSTFVLTTETFQKIYGSVVSFYENYPEEKLLEEQKYKLGLLRGDGVKSTGTKSIHTNKAICILSKWPLFDAFRDILIYLYRLTVSPQAHPVPVERYISHFLHEVPFPTQHRPRVQYQMSPMHATILTRPQITPIPLSGASFVALLDDLGAENLLQLFTLALTEHKIVIHSLRQAEITRVAEAIITLLFPFKWQCTYVPLCPLEMAYVLEAPTPFIVGVDSRYFDLYEPPADVVCVNLDTHSITHVEESKVTWRMLPKKAARVLRSKLQELFVEIKQTNLSEDPNMPFVFDPDFAKTKRHMQVEIIIQEAVLKLMVAIMDGYRDFLRPITVAPSTGTADAASLFNINDFNKLKDRSTHRFYSIFTNTQIFLTFIEERSLGRGGMVSDRGEKAVSLVFFDDCMEKMENEHSADVRLIEPDDTIASGPTVFISAPDERRGETGGYQYTTFPELKAELFLLDGEEHPVDTSPTQTTTRRRRRSSSLMFGKRTKQETKMTLREAKMNNRDPKLWARVLFSSAFSIWFNCLPEFTRQCKSKEAALRAGHTALKTLKQSGCIPLPDETPYRVLMHLCYVYNKPALALRIYQFIKSTGGQLSALSYGLYNKALLESNWPTTNRDGYMLWQKLRNVIIATAKFRYALRYQSNNNSAGMGTTDESSDFDSAHSIESGKDNGSNFGSLEKKKSNLSPPTHYTKMLPSHDLLKDAINKDVQSDHGYNSLPKDTNPTSYSPRLSEPNVEATDSVISTTSESTTDSRSDPPKYERSLSSRSAQPPTTLLIPDINIPGGGAGDSGVNNKLPDQGLQSDETIVDYQHGEMLIDGTGDHKPLIQKQEDTNSRTGSIVRTPGTPGSVSSGVLTPNKFSQENLAENDKNEIDQIEDVFKQTGTPLTPAKASPVTSRRKFNSPTPELETFFGGDSKFLADLSDSDKQRHHELSSRHSSTIDSPVSANFPRDRSASALLLPSHKLSVGGTISPLVSHKGGFGFTGISKSVASTPMQGATTNFDSLTADDLIGQTHTSPRHGSIFSSVGSNRVHHPRSPLHEEDEATATPSKRYIRTAPGTHALHVVDGVAMLTSTPMRLLASEKESESQDEQNKRNARQKLKMERRDITHLALDPLSALSINEPIDEAIPIKHDEVIEEAPAPKSRPLVEEIENHQKRDSFSTNGISRSKSVSMNNTISNAQDLRRHMSHVDAKTKKEKTAGRPPALSRSMTFHPDKTPLSNSFLGSKFNDMLKSTTMEMANKAKKLASNIAKDFNDTVQTNLAYYTPEKFKGSLPDILKEEENRQSVGSSRNDLYSSQSSLRSSESQQSGTDGGHHEEVRRRTKSMKTQRRKKVNRPLSLPPQNMNDSQRQQSFLGVPGMNSFFSVDNNVSASTNSLNTKGTVDIEVLMSSCSQCHKCKSLVYDEEIMAGWIADESNLNTHCPFCSGEFVPFLNIDLRDFRKYNESVLSSRVSNSAELSSAGSEPSKQMNTSCSSEQVPTNQQFSASFNLDSSEANNCATLNDVTPLSPDVVVTPPTDATTVPATATDPTATSLDATVPKPSVSQSSSTNEKSANTTNNHSRSLSQHSQASNPSTSMIFEATSEESLNVPMFEELEPITIPYLSPLVLRKNMESLLENEGTHVLTDASFVDKHPIMYWNLIWYFRRLNLHSNLYNLLLASKYVNHDKSEEDRSTKGSVAIRTMWDNLKLHKEMAKPPFYWVWHQAKLNQLVYLPYPIAFLTDITNSIMQDDLRGPLVSTLHELSSHGATAGRRSAYREILYLVIIALEKESIDVDAFDRVYKSAYEGLNMEELTLAKKCDKNLSRHAIECRNIFGQLDLY